MKFTFSHPIYIYLPNTKPRVEVLDVSDNQDLRGSLQNFREDGYLQTLNLSYIT